MPSIEFWEGNPRFILSYIEAYRLKMEREEQVQSQVIDYTAWLHGAYVQTAVGVVLSNAFGKKGSKAKYPEKPISMSAVDKKSHVEDDKKTLVNQFAGFQSLVNELNKNRVKGR